MPREREEDKVPTYHKPDHRQKREDRKKRAVFLFFKSLPAIGTRAPKTSVFPEDTVINKDSSPASGRSASSPSKSSPQYATPGRQGHAMTRAKDKDDVIMCEWLAIRLQ